jgi:hypothetical protein
MSPGQLMWIVANPTMCSSVVPLVQFAMGHSTIGMVYSCTPGPVWPGKTHVLPTQF